MLKRAVLREIPSLFPTPYDKVFFCKVAAGNYFKQINLLPTPNPVMQSKDIGIAIFSFGWKYKMLTPKLFIFLRVEIVSDIRNVD